MSFVMDNHAQDNSLKVFVFFAFVLLCGSVQWPAGKYGLPKAKSGCPSAIGFQWQTGWRFQDTEDNNPNNYHSTNFHLDGSVGKINLKRYFCMKTDMRNDSGRASWPTGEYCIYRKGSSCPSGLTSGWIRWDDENSGNINDYGGTIPDGIYDNNTVIYFCCRSDGQKAEPITLPTTAPFFLLAHKSATCQQVKFAISSTEWIRFDTEDTNNKNGYGGKYPYGAGLNDHTIHYCYYTSCNYTLNASTGTFNSPNYPQPYPNGQYCSWRITVQSGIQIVLKFSTFTLQSGSSADNVKVFDGPNESSPSLGVFSGLRSPPPTGVVSSSNDMFVLFKSNGSTNGTGFNATYTTMVITTSGPSTTVTTKSTGTTNASSTTTKEHPVTTTGTSVTTTGVTEPLPSVTTAISETPSEISTTSNAERTITAASTIVTAETELKQSSPGVTEVIVTPTEYVAITSIPSRKSSHAFKNPSDDEGTNLAVIIIVPLLLLLVIIGLGIFVYFLCRKRMDEPGRPYLVFYNSNGDVYAMPNKERSPALVLNEAHVVMGYENQIYDTHAQRDLENESFA